MNYTDIVGQTYIIDSLKEALSKNKIGNAYLFYGLAGIGKKSIAEVFAKAINCTANIEGELKPCDKCPSCKRADSGNHPNIEWVRPDGASIKIKQINQVVSDVSKKPYTSGYKVVIIDRADKMTIDSQNAFLKTLEEPPILTVFFILAENPGNLLPTVISRCQSFRVKAVSNSEIVTYLKKRNSKEDFDEKDLDEKNLGKKDINDKNLDEKDLDLIKLASAFSNGIIGRAIEMMEKPEYFKKRADNGEIISSLFNGKCKLGEDYLFYTSRAEAEIFVEFTRSFIRDIMVILELGEQVGGNILNHDLMEVLKKSSEKLNIRKLLKVAEILKKCSEYLKRNVNIKGCMDSMLLNILEVTNG